MSQETRFVWTGQREEAAVLVAEGDLTDQAIAGKVGIERRTLARWKLHPTFQAKVEQIEQRLAAAIMRHAIAKRERRVRILNDLLRREQQVIEERAAATEMQDVPGGKAGVLTRTLKSIGVGQNQQTIEEFAFDRGLTSEIRATLEQAAKELGQWTEKKDVTSAGEPITFTIEFDRRDDAD